MRLIIFTVIALLLCACDQIHDFTKSYPIDMDFKHREFNITLNEKDYLFDLAVQLSFKEDMKGYYNIKVVGGIDELLSNHRIYLRFIDKNDMILYEMSPGWSTNDTVTKINNGISRRGTFAINEGVFNEFKNYEIIFKPKQLVRANKLINKDKIWLAISLHSILANQILPVIKALNSRGENEAFKYN